MNHDDKQLVTAIAPARPAALARFVVADMAIIDWARGDIGGLEFPAHPDALLAGGADFLTRAFRASGALAPDNHVSRIVAFSDWPLGGTGRKALLTIAYQHDAPGLPCDLFVKFSRNFGDKVRDGGRHHMPPEVRLAILSRRPGFPVAVPRCLYADIAEATLTGIIITERIAYGVAPIEPHHAKCMDHLLPDAIAHYRALIADLARLSGAHRAGRLGDAVARSFPFDPERAIAARASLDPPLTAKRIERLTQFIGRYPHLFPAHLTDDAFLADFRAGAAVAVERQQTIWRQLYAPPEMIALCHMNANIDNAWFRREADGTLRSGLIDWGSVGQMPVASSIWGCIGAAEPETHDRYFDELLDQFVRGYAAAGGPELDRSELTRHLQLHVAMSALHMTTAPPAILREIPDPDVVADRFDPLFTANETARVQLKITVSVLNMWARQGLGDVVRSIGAGPSY